MPTSGASWCASLGATHVVAAARRRRRRRRLLLRPPQPPHPALSLPSRRPSRSPSRLLPP
eukprot:4848875-Pleurochrysis_carterae.AAC.3